MKTPCAAALGAPADASVAAASALAGSGRRLSAIDPRLGFTLDPTPDTSGMFSTSNHAGIAEGRWVRLDHLRPAMLARWIDEKAGAAGGHRGIATGSIAEALARRVIAPSVACWALEGCLPSLRPSHVLVHRDQEGSFDRTALSSPSFAVPITDPAAVSPDAWPLTNHHDLRQWLAVGLLRTLGPLFGTVRQAGRYGLRGLWGLAADAAGGTLVGLVRLGHLDTAGGARMWEEVDAAFDVLRRLGVPARTRPQVRAGRYDGIETLVSVRGVCCLYCATSAGTARPKPDRYCASCPRLSEADRDARLASVLHV